jgi:molybdate transport system substrate-binding protein
VPPIKTLSIPEKYNVAATYYIASVKGAAHAEAGKAFVAYALSTEGQAVMEKYGFSRANATKP